MASVGDSGVFSNSVPSAEAEPRASARGAEPKLSARHADPDPVLFGGGLRGDAKQSVRPSLRPANRTSAYALADSLEHRSSLTALARGAETRRVLPRLLAEAVGTFFLMLAVGLAVAGGGAFAPVAIGLVLSVQIYTFGSVSGGLFNPAVTLAVLLSGRDKISRKDAAAYAAVQCFSALVAGLIAMATTKSSFYFDYELTPAGGWGSSLFLEILYTAALCSTVLTTGTSRDTPNHYFGFAIGCTVLAAAYANGKFNQGSFNPAVTFGANLAHAARGEGSAGPSAGAWLLFLVGPCLGGVLAAGIFRLTRSSEYGLRVLEPVANSLQERALAEFVGTAYLVLTVCMAVAGGGPFAPVAIGLILAVQVYTFGSVSGACLNPAVTVAVLLSGRGKISPRDAAAYIGAQLFGGLVAGWAANLITATSFCFSYDLPLHGSWGTSLLLEICFTAALCGTVLSTGTSFDAPNEYFGFAIGGTVLASAYACSGFDQGSFNPAVTFGANVANYFNGESVNPSFGAWVLFLLAPVVGGCLAAGIFRATRLSEYGEDAKAARDTELATE